MHGCMIIMRCTHDLRMRPCQPRLWVCSPTGNLIVTLYCAITALDRYPSHSDNIHYIRSATLIYVLLPSMDHAITSILDTPYIRLLLPADICLRPSQATQATSSAHL